ncbi:hypothetical protein Tco_0742608, partial [Tanacetum coccineum]
MSTQVFVDPEISTQVDGAQSSRVPVPLPEDPYEAIRQAYLVGTDTEFEPIETKAPESPHTVASPTLLPDSTPPTCHDEELEGSDTSGARSTSSDSTAPLLPDHPLTHATPTLVPVLRRTARIVVHIPQAMSPSLSASMAKVAAMSDSAFRKRMIRGDDEEEDEEIEESSNSDSVSEDVEDDGPTAEDKDPVAGDEGLATGDEGPGMGVESPSLGGDEAVPGGQQRAAPVAETVVGQSSGSVQEFERPEIVSALRQPTLTTWMDPEDGIVYIDVPTYPPLAPPAQTPPSLEWSSSSLPISPAPSIVPSPMISLTVPSPVASPATTKTEGFLTELGARVEMQGGLIRDHTLAKERRVRLELAEVVDSMRRG